jgi:hypothetical protein
MFNNVFFESRAIYEIMWKNVVEMGRPQMIWRMRIAYWIPFLLSPCCRVLIEKLTGPQLVK